MVSSLQTNDPEDKYRHVRIFKPDQREQRNKLWETRKTQIQWDVKDEAEVAKQLALEKEAFDNPAQTKRANGKYAGPLFAKILHPEFTKRQRQALSCQDYREKQWAEKREKEVKQTFLDLEQTMTHARIPTIPGTCYHSGLDSMIHEQPEKPGMVNLYMANFDRFLNIFKQLQPYGVYTEEEEEDIDTDEQTYLIITDPGQPNLHDDDHQIQQNHQLYGQNASQISDEETIMPDETSSGGTVTTHPTDQASAFTETGTDSRSRADNNSVATEIITDERLTDDTLSTADSIQTQYTQQGRTNSKYEDNSLARPKAGWDFATYPSFGTLVPPLENSGEDIYNIYN